MRSATYKVFDEKFNVRDIREPFILSMMLVVDEMATSDHKKLLFVEFLEFLVRIAFVKYDLRARYSVGVNEVVEATNRLLVEHIQSDLGPCVFHHCNRDSVCLTKTHSQKKNNNNNNEQQ